ncbi:DUF2971 domain-containing protein [Bartonella sp. HY406]|uniref:DUF2971 domain-containing protein n=1 Tax=Bartonella sp. HY406 TaxID=2979331 RepID=UPI0021CAAF80|nr:DUF2971 domain-containing protein [Bartonella sp. HY406]UXN02263.1 DUF2971 domain-containing protein [Bartonella sp. HY406]
MEIPKSLFRYRSLASLELFVRGFEAIQNSYLFGASFYQMNDPMEAFYKFGSSSDELLDKTINFKCADIYQIFQDIIDKWGLISFATCPDNILMWAHYAASFSGICLELDTQKLIAGGFERDTLRAVTYSNDALPNISLNSVIGGGDVFQNAMGDRLSRKRLEWAYEDEWRFILGGTGRRYYFDDALVRVYLGPRINIKYKEQLKKLFKRRQVEVMEGIIEGFQLRFELNQPLPPLSRIERIGTGFGDFKILYDEKEEISKFLIVPFEDFITFCKKLAKHPNFVKFVYVAMSTDFNGSIFLWSEFKFRDGSSKPQKIYLDENLNILT